MTIPTLNDFWHFFDHSRYNEETGSYEPIYKDSNCFIESIRSYEEHPDDRSKQYLILQNIETLEYWAVLVHKSIDSWDDSSNEERFIRGPFKVKQESKQITLTKYYYTEIKSV